MLSTFIIAEGQISGTDIVLGGATADDALVERIVERTKAAEVAELRERAAAAEAEAATLRAMLGISNAGGERSMEARVAAALTTLQSGAIRLPELRGSEATTRFTEPAMRVKQVGTIHPPSRFF